MNPGYVQWFSIIKDGVLALAGIIASIVAIKGLSAWRRQIEWKTKYDLAKETLKTFYKLRDLAIGLWYERSGLLRLIYMIGNVPAKYDERLLASFIKLSTEEMETFDDISRNLVENNLEVEAVWGSAIRKELDRQHSGIQWIRQILWVLLFNVKQAPSANELVSHLDQETREEAKDMWENREGKIEVFKTELQGYIRNVEKLLIPKIAR